MPTNAKIPIVILNGLFRWKYNKFVAQGIAILEGYFFNEPMKSSLTGKKFPNLVTLTLTLKLKY